MASLVIPAAIISSIVLLNGPFIARGYLQEGKVHYLHSTVSVSLRSRVPVLIERWEVIVSRLWYVQGICSVKGLPYRTNSTNHSDRFTASVAPCGTVQVDCIPPRHGRCISTQVITVHTAYNLNLTFTTFNVCNSFSHCRLQSLRVSYNRGGSQSFTKEFCGIRLSWSEYHQFNNATLFYQSSIPYKAQISGVYEILEPGEISQGHHIKISSVYKVNRTFLHPFTGDGITRVRGIETQTFHILGKLYSRIQLSALHESHMDGAHFDISAFDGPGLQSRMLYKDSIFRLASLHSLETSNDLNTGGCQRSHYLPWVSTFEQTKGFQITVRVRGNPLTRYCGGHTGIELEYDHITVEPIYITVSPLPTQLIIPNHACQEDTFYLTLCYFHIQAIGASVSDIERGFVKVTVENINVDGPNTEDCQISGLALVSIANDTNLERFIVNQNPVVVICRNTMTWTNNSITVPFTNFISHTPDIALVVYSYNPKITMLKASLTLWHSRCQGLLLDCIPTQGPGYQKQIQYVTSDINTQHVIEKISRLESAGMQAHGECWNYLLPNFESPSNYMFHSIHKNDVYIRDATIVWCTSPSDFGYLGRTKTTNTTRFLNINLHHTTNCIVVQSYPIIGNTQYLGTKDCKLDVIFIDTQARFRRNHFHRNLVADDKNKICEQQEYLKLTESKFSNENNIFPGQKKGRQIKFWAVSVDLKKCGYSYIHLNTTKSSHMTIPLLPPRRWTKFLPFRLPLQGNNLFQELIHKILISNEQEHSVVIAHFDPSQYLLNTMGKVPSFVNSVPNYATTITLVSLLSSDCNVTLVTMDVIIRSTSDLFPYFYHRFSMQLDLTLMRTFTFTEYLLMEQRYIRILPYQPLACDGFVQLKINPQQPLPELNTLPLTVRGMFPSRGRQLFENHDYIILFDQFNLDWNTASEKCNSLGRMLPVLHSETNVKMLTRLLLGDTFSQGKGRRYIRTPCRQNYGPFCATFLGLRLNKDSVSYIINTLY